MTGPSSSPSVREALGTDGFDRAFAAGSRLSGQEAAAVTHDDRPTAGTRGLTPADRPMGHLGAPSAAVRPQWLTGDHAGSCSARSAQVESAAIASATPPPGAHRRRRDGHARVVW